MLLQVRRILVRTLVDAVDEILRLLLSLLSISRLWGEIAFFDLTSLVTDRILRSLMVGILVDRPEIFGLLLRRVLRLYRLVWVLACRLSILRTCTWGVVGLRWIVRHRVIFWSTPWRFFGVTEVRHLAVFTLVVWIIGEILRILRRLFDRKVLDRLLVTLVRICHCCWLRLCRWRRRPSGGR